ncbi:hypothetical protein BU24DRAFT_461910 [Aaosphaeria arxii CBS 175.79]|uniref:Uncharacterized protein n=1 Tax=Aaosphaeria arxii CBS 175.79 TaxID=1450172 RepID=A0A6A5XTV1_9PLEO|nr:uncharacterized protein BU24DRAFT_461910 [Aaosphaeria arxii CBS 175.79]KAF2015674.1 hypothetical protein BU24DRAFT_461910 [Aaosphaeria arxii CBS 175.79]
MGASAARASWVQKHKSSGRISDTISTVQNVASHRQDGLISHLPMQVDQSWVLTEAFYGKFLAYFSSGGESRDLRNRLTWLHELPTLSTDGTNTALALAIRASASIYCGAESSSIPLQQKAFKLYGQALATHAKILRSNPKLITVHMISTSVMLSLFEAMQATTADAYRSHIYGAARLIELTTPGQCVFGVLCQLFFHIRTQMAFIYLTTAKHHSMPVTRILTETLSYQDVPVIQRLMSHIAALAQMFHKNTSITALEHCLELETYQRVKMGVEALWTEYSWQALSSNEQLSYVIDTGENVYRDSFTALTVAYFACAEILFRILAPRLSQPYEDSRDPYTAIIACAHYLDPCNIGFAFMRMATPLYLVALYSPKEEQRSEAINVFQSWENGHMSGISALALETIRIRTSQGNRSNT